MPCGRAGSLPPPRPLPSPRSCGAPPWPSQLAYQEARGPEQPGGRARPSAFSTRSACRLARPSPASPPPSLAPVRPPRPARAVAGVSQLPQGQRQPSGCPAPAPSAPPHLLPFRHLPSAPLPVLASREPASPSSGPFKPCRLAEACATPPTTPKASPVSVGCPLKRCCLCSRWLARKWLGGCTWLSALVVRPLCRARLENWRLHRAAGVSSRAAAALALRRPCWVSVQGLEAGKQVSSAPRGCSPGLSGVGCPPPCPSIKQGSRRLPRAWLAGPCTAPEAAPPPSGPRLKQQPQRGLWPLWFSVPPCLCSICSSPCPPASLFPGTALLLLSWLRPPPTGCAVVPLVPDWSSGSTGSRRHPARKPPVHAQGPGTALLALPACPACLSAAPVGCL